MKTKNLILLLIVAAVIYHFYKNKSKAQQTNTASNSGSGGSVAGAPAGGSVVDQLRNASTPMGSGTVPELNNSTGSEVAIDLSGWSDGGIVQTYAPGGGVNATNTSGQGGLGAVQENLVSLGNSTGIVEVI